NNPRNSTTNPLRARRLLPTTIATSVRASLSLATSSLSNPPSPEPSPCSQSPPRRQPPFNGAVALNPLQAPPGTHCIRRRDRPATALCRFVIFIKIICIGATTLDEYRIHIEKDPALYRRFQCVRLPESTVAESIQILRGLRERYEIHHQLRYTDEALVVAAAELSHRYIRQHNQRIFAVVISGVLWSCDMFMF
ncbi:ATP-dependent Clp protease ATP-binding subunit ClpA homolog, chloroplastic-like protein, partial [Drosera capensis]